MRNWIIEHPWKVLADEIKARWLTQKAFAEALGKERLYINHITSWRRNIGVDLAVKMEDVFWMDAKLWLSLQMDYDIYKSKTKNK